MKLSFKFLTTALAVGLVGLTSCKSKQQNDAVKPDAELAKVQFNADSAYQYIVDQCDFGARVPNSEAHDRCADYIVKAFKRFGLTVNEQKTTVKGWDGKMLQCNNITASYKPELRERIVICSHWDSRPWADADPDSSKHHEPVMAANDGASGVAVMMELARQIHQLNPSVGVDFVCFDSEDYGAPYWGPQTKDENDWCLGSQYWANNLPKDYKPRYGILLDMVGGDDAQFKFEYYSMQYAQNVVAKVWSAAQSVVADNYFLQQDGTAVTDDHIPMNRIANIPTIDIISDNGNGFSRTWHTTMDTPQNISRETLKAVGQTLVQTLFEEK